MALDTQLGSLEHLGEQTELSCLSFKARQAEDRLIYSRRDFALRPKRQPSLPLALVLELHGGTEVLTKVLFTSTITKSAAV